MFANRSDLKGLYAAIVSIWIYLLDEKHEAAKDLAKYSWFFFRIIAKSMVLELQETGKINAENTRKGRFSEFMTQLYLLVGQIAAENQKLAKISLGLARSLNYNLANFLSDLLGIYYFYLILYIYSITFIDIGDRGQVFRLIHLYIRKLDPTNQTMELVECKFAFLRVLSHHEYYIPLNMLSPTVIPAVPEIFSTFLYANIITKTYLIASTAKITSLWGYCWPK